MSVYFIEDKQEQAVKIGYSTDPEGRFYGIQTGNPRELVYLGCIEGGKPLENKLHRQFRDAHISGEWYSLTQEVCQYLSSLDLNVIIQSKTSKEIELGYAFDENNKLITHYNAVLLEQVDLLLKTKTKLEDRIKNLELLVEAQAQTIELVQRTDAITTKRTQ